MQFTYEPCGSPPRPEKPLVKSEEDSRHSRDLEKVLAKIPDGALRALFRSMHQEDEVIEHDIADKLTDDYTGDPLHNACRIFHLVADERHVASASAISPYPSLIKTDTSDIQAPTVKTAEHVGSRAKCYNADDELAPDGPDSFNPPLIPPPPRI